MSAKPLLLGYQSLRLDSTDDAAENGRRVLAAFADREGYAMGAIFTDLVYGRMAAFDALLDAVSTGGVAVVGIPTPEDLSPMPRLREAMRLRLQQAGGVPILIVQHSVDRESLDSAARPPAFAGRYEVRR